MTKITSFDLAPFYRNSVGVDRLFDRIVSQFEQTTSSSNNYPPYNIVKTGDNTFEIQVQGRSLFLSAFSQACVCLCMSQ
jgi:HSP20 family molecular chaperone IbpA